MAEYIDRAAVICAITNYGMRNREYTRGWATIIQEGVIADVINGVMHIPHADVAAVKHGRWIDYMPALGAGDMQTRCSECGLTNDAKTNYCPYCGAKMDLEE